MCTLYSVNNAEKTSRHYTDSKPPRDPLSMGSTKALYASLFFAAGGLMKDFPSGPVSTVPRLAWAQCAS